MLFPLLIWLVGRVGTYFINTAQAVAQAEQEAVVVVVYETVYEIIPARIGYVAVEKPPRLSSDDRHLIERVIMAECGHQVFEGIWAVAECLYNAMNGQEFTAAQAIKYYGYTQTRMEPNAQVKAAVQLVFENEMMLINDPEMKWFYNPEYGSSPFHESREKVVVIQDHHFYR